MATFRVPAFSSEPQSKFGALPCWVSTPSHCCHRVPFTVINNGLRLRDTPFPCFPDPLRRQSHFCVAPAAVRGSAPFPPVSSCWLTACRMKPEADEALSVARPKRKSHKRAKKCDFRNDGREFGSARPRAMTAENRMPCTWSAPPGRRYGWFPARLIFTRVSSLRGTLQP